MKVFITDFIKNPSVEKKILKNYLITNNKYKFEAEILLVWHHKINKDYINKFKKLKYVVRYGTGYDDIDLVTLKKKNILFSNNPDYGTYEVSNTALAMILNITRSISKYNEISKISKKNIWQENFISNIKSAKKTRVGIIGAGRIGSTLITKLNYIGYETLFYDPFKDYGYEKVINSNRTASINELLSKSDIISVNCDLNKDTHSLIDKKFISNMKKGSSLINTARGKIISNLDDFYKPLKEKKINSVFLDVLPEEPPFDCKIIQSWRSNESWISGRFIVNPHSAFYSKESYQEMRRTAAINAFNFINKKKLNNIISA